MSADLVVVSSAFVATALLALGMKTHGRAALTGGGLARVPAVVWKAAGWLGVVVTLAVAVRAHGWGVGVVLWLLALGAKGFAVTLVLSYRPRGLLVLGGAAAGIAGALWVFAS